MLAIIIYSSGLIGRTLTTDLIRNSHEGIIISRKPERIIDLPAGVRVEKWEGHATGSRLQTLI